MAPNKKNKVHFPKDKKIFEEEMKNNSISFVKFYSPTCTHCSNMQNAWNMLNTNSMLDHVGLFEVDVTQKQMIPSSCNIPPETGVPYIILIDSNGTKINEYTGDRSTSDMENFILSNTKPIPHAAKPIPHAAKPEHHQRQRRRAGGRTKKNKRRYRQTRRKTIRRKTIRLKTIKK